MAIPIKVFAFVSLVLFCSCVKPKSFENSSTAGKLRLELIDTIWVPMMWKANVSDQRNYSFEFEGTVESLYVKSGDRVVAGQKLAALRSSEVQSKIALQRLVLKSSESELMRVNQLYDQQARTAVQKEDAQMRLNMAKEQLNYLTEELKNRTIVAQATGVVSAVNYKSSEYAGKGAVVIVVDESKSPQGVCEFPLPSSVFADNQPITLLLKGGVKVIASSSNVHSGNGIVLHFQNDTKSTSGLCRVPVTGAVAKLEGIALKQGDLVEVVMGSKKALAIGVKVSGLQSWISIVDGSLNSGDVDYVIR